MQMGTGVDGGVLEEEEQAAGAAIIASQQSSHSGTSHHSHSHSSHGSGRSLQVSPPSAATASVKATNVLQEQSTSNNTPAEHHHHREVREVRERSRDRDRHSHSHHHNNQQQSNSTSSAANASSNSSFIPRRTRHRVDAGEPRGCFNNFYPSNSHSGTPFRFLYSSQAAAAAQAQHHQHNQQQHHQQNQHNSGSSNSPFLLGGENSHPLIAGLPRLYQQQQQQPPQPPNHRSVVQQHQHSHTHPAVAAFAAAAAAGISPHGLPHHHPGLQAGAPPHSHSHSLHSQAQQQAAQQQAQLLLFEQHQREQQLKMLGAQLQQQEYLREMLTKKSGAATGAAANNAGAVVNNNNNNTIMGLKTGKSGYEEDCEEIARAREEIAIEKSVPRHDPVSVNVNSNASSGSGAGSADSVISGSASVNNVSSATRINGCKKRKLYQPQRSDIDGKTPSERGGNTATGPGSQAGEGGSNSGGLRSDDEDELMMDEGYEAIHEDGEGDGDGDDDCVLESIPVETELGACDDDDEDEFVKKEDEANPHDEQDGNEKVNRGGRFISENNNNLSQHAQGTKRVLRSQHRQQQQQQSGTTTIHGSQHHSHREQRERDRERDRDHHQQLHNNKHDHSELLMNEISERKEKYGGLMMPQFKRASPNSFLQQQQQQQLAPITRQLLQAEHNSSNSRSSPLKQLHGLGLSVAASAAAASSSAPPIAQQQFQQLLQFRDSLKSTLIPHLNEFIDTQFTIFLQQQQQLFQAHLLQEQQRVAQDHLRRERERPPSTNSHHESHGLMHQQQQNVLLNGGGSTTVTNSNGPRSLLVKSPGFPGTGFNHLKSVQAQQQAAQQTGPHHQNPFTSALIYHNATRNNGLYMDDMDGDSPLSLVVTPKKKRSKVTDTRLTPRAVHRLLENTASGLHHRGGGVIGVDVDRPTYIPEELGSPPPPSTVLPPHQLPSVLPSGGSGDPRLPNGGGPLSSLMDRTFNPSASAGVAMQLAYNAAILNGLQAQAQQQQQQRGGGCGGESPIPATLLPTAVRDRGGLGLSLRDRDREDREDRKRNNNNNNGANNANLEEYVQQLREMNNNSAGSADSQDTVGSYDLRECGSSYGGQSITSTAPLGGTSSTLTPMHLRKAKLMFFWVRYPSSAVLKMYFPDIRFNKNNTAQLVKWFSNFREFYYIQMEKYSRQAIAEGIKAPEEIIVTTDHELYRVLNLHYNRNNHIEVPTNFRYVVEQTLREFFKSVQVGKDSEQSWKKAIYKIIARLDDPVPEYFKSSNFLEQLE